MRQRRAILALAVRACLAAGVGLGIAGTDPATAADDSTGGSFLPLGHGARAHGLGGAGTALLRDDAAVYWNPANLSWIQSRAGLTLMVAEIFPGVGDGYQTLSYARRAGPLLGEKGQSLQPARFGYGLFYSHLGLDFDAGVWAENVMRIGGSWAFTNYASLGVVAKILWLDNSFESGGAHGGGFDLALSTLVVPRLFAALVARDVYTSVLYETGTSQRQASELDLGTELRAGYGATLVADFAWRETVLRHTNLGIEWRGFQDVVALRGGWSLVGGSESRAFPSAGAGIGWDRFQLDYGVSFDGDDALGAKQRLSLHVQL